MCNFDYLLEDAVAPPRRLDGGVYEQLRAIQRSITKDMYDYAVRRTGCFLQRNILVIDKDASLRRGPGNAARLPRLGSRTFYLTLLLGQRVEPSAAHTLAFDTIQA